MITVHHLDHSRSQRVLWMLEELELPYEMVTYQRNPKTMLAPDSLKAIHPLGKSPVLVDDGLVLAESGAILEYLVEKYGKGKLIPPADTQARIDYRYFMHYAEGSLMPYLLLALIFSKVRTAPVPFFIKPIVKKIADTVTGDFVSPNLTRHIAFLGQHLDKHTWFAGDELSAADIQMSYGMEAIGSRAKQLNPPASIGKWVAAIHARPAYQRALAKGGPVIPD